VTAASINQNPYHDSEQQHPDGGGVKGERRPVGGEVFHRDEEHEVILAEERGRGETATIGQLLSESESPMLIAGVNDTPDVTSLPGSAALQQIVNGVAAWALVGSLLALLIGAALWAIGSHTQNMHQSAAGRRAVGTSLVAAILIGAAPHLITFFFNTGSSVH
jgi:hypothetical protein